MACASARMTRMGAAFSAAPGAGAGLTVGFPDWLVIFFFQAVAPEVMSDARPTSRPLETILVDHRRDGATSIFHKTPHHASHTVHLDCRWRAQHIGGHGEIEFYDGTHRQVGLEIKQHAAGRDVGGFRLMLILLCLHLDGQAQREADCATQFADLSSSTQGEASLSQDGRRAKLRWS